VKKALKDFEKRKIEHNVATGNQKDEQKMLIFKDGEVAKMKIAEKRNGLPEIELFDLESEEDRDQHSIKIFLKKYSKLWKMLYYKYGNSCYSTLQINNFDDLKVKTETINIAELQKMLIEHSFDKKKWVSKDEICRLVTLINFKIQKRFDARGLNEEGFKEFMLQFPMYIFSKPKTPKDLSDFPPLKSLEEFVNKMKASVKKKKQNTILYENPDATSIADPDLVKALNKKLEEDPAYPVPEGFKKVIEKSLVYSRGPPEYMGLSEAQTESISFLDELVDKLFDFHFLEPVCSFEEKHKIRPVIHKKFKDGKRVETPRYLQALEK